MVNLKELEWNTLENMVITWNSVFGHIEELKSNTNKGFILNEIHL